jgi:hypothetical protein
VRLQSQVLDSTARFDGPIDCLVKTFQGEGVRGLYRVSPPSLGVLRNLWALQLAGPASPDSWCHVRNRVNILLIQRISRTNTALDKSATV